MLLPLHLNEATGVTARYQAQVDAASRQPFWIVEIDQPRCTLTYTRGACTAVDLGDGSRCWYTYHTCQDRANYTAGTRTWRFATHPIPQDIVHGYAQLWPVIESITPIPQNVSVSGAFTESEAMTVRLTDLGTAPGASDPVMLLPPWDVDKG